MTKRIIFTLFFVLVYSTAFSNDCIPPGYKLKEYKYTPPAEEINNKAKTDSFVLALSWSKNFCAEQLKKNKGTLLEEHQFQCGNNKKFGLVVHGLWAQSNNAKNPQRDNPRNCADKPNLPADFLAKYICIMPGAKLMQSEWEKHGTCNNDFSSAEEYFERIKQLYEKLSIPSKDELEKIEKASAIAIKKFFVEANKANGLQECAVEVAKDKQTGVLEEIYIHYDKDFNFLCKNKE